MTTLTQMKKALEAPNAAAMFAKFDEIGLDNSDVALLMDNDVCDESSLIKSTVEELTGFGLTAESAAALKGVFPSAS